jgi:hypothetical protein
MHDVGGRPKPNYDTTGWTMPLPAIFVPMASSPTMMMRGRCAALAEFITSRRMVANIPIDLSGQAFSPISANP